MKKRAMGWLDWRSPIRSGFSAASTSRSPTQNGIASGSQTAWLELPGGRGGSA